MEYRKYPGAIADSVRHVTENIDPDSALAKALGWASIGIGLMEVAAPKVVENMLGIDHTLANRGTLRALGVRELCQGAAILSEEEVTPQLKCSLWARVLGDVLDTVCLGKAAMKTRRPGSFAAVAASVAVIGVLDLICAKRLSNRLS